MYRKRTKELIDRICDLYPYPKVKITDGNNEIVGENESLDIASDLLFDHSNFIDLEKNRIYVSNDNKEGYVLYTSKVNKQGDRDKYWFGYRTSRLEKIKNTEKKYFILVCRNSKTLILKFPKEFIDGICDRLNSTEDENGIVKHYHIVFYSMIKISALCCCQSQIYLK